MKYSLSVVLLIPAAHKDAINALAEHWARALEANSLIADMVNEASI